MNRLRHISDAVAAGTFSTDIDNQQTDNYGYDANGSLEKDLQRDVAFAVNDIRNLPVSVWKASTGQELKYYYDTDGRRIRKDAGSTEYYVNGLTGETEVIVKSDESGATHSILGRDDLGQVKRTGGSFARYYYLKDHLGTIKMTVDASCNTTGYDDYYPFGQQMDGRCYTSSSDARYKYTSKERDAESGYDYFGARYYDARVGRFLGVDAHGSNYPDLSSYCYVGNNPLSFVDPTGMDSMKAANVFPVVLTLPALPFLPTVINVPSVIHGLATLGSTVVRVTPLGLAFLPLSDAPNSLMQETAAGDNTKPKAEVAKGKQASQEGSSDETSELEKRVAEHQKKLEDYKANPEKFDNKDFLKNAPTKEIRDRIIKGRVKHLENEIRAMLKALEGQRGGTGK